MRTRSSTAPSSLAAWGWLELTAGANLVRRAMGAAGLVMAVTGIAGRG